jgi:hypothetical protein
MAVDGVPTVREFAAQLEKMGRQGDEARVAEQLILSLCQRDIVFLMRITVKAIQLPGASERLLFMANLVIFRCVTPTRTLSLATIRTDWLNPALAEMRSDVKYSLQLCLMHPSVAVRNQAARNVAHVFRIEFGKWPDFFSALRDFLFSESSSSDFRLGALRALWEVLQLRVLANGPALLVDFPDLVPIAQCIVAWLAAPSADAIAHEACAECLRAFVDEIPAVLDAPACVNCVLEAIVARLPAADLGLYRTLHWVMLGLLKAFYGHAEVFLEQIFTITTVGFQCAFAHISIDFWSYFCDFEFEVRAEAIAAEERGCTPQRPFHNFAEIAARSLTGVCLNLLDRTRENPDDLSDHDTESADGVCFYASHLLSRLLEAAPWGADSVFDFIHAHAACDAWEARLSALYALTALCGGGDFKSRAGFVCNHFGFVCLMCANATPRVALTAYHVLAEAAAAFGAVLTPFAADALTAMGIAVERPVEIACAMMDALTAFGNALPLADLAASFPRIDALFRRLIAHRPLIESDSAVRPYTVFGAIVLRVGTLRSPDIEALLHFMLEIAPAVFDPLRGFTKLQRHGFAWLLADVVVALDQGVVKFARPLFHFLMSTLANPGLFELFELMLQALHVLLNVCPEAATEMEGPLLGQLHSAMTTQDPRTMGMAALVLGAFFKRGGQRTVHCLEGPLNCLMEMLMDRTVEVASVWYMNVLYAIGFTIQGIREAFPVPIRDAYFAKLAELGRFVGDNPEGAAYLFEGVAFGFAAFADVATAEEITKDRLMAVLRFCKTVVASHLKADGMLDAIRQMLFNIATKKGRPANMCLNAVAVTDLIKRARSIKTDDSLWQAQFDKLADLLAKL